jgi:Rrf2 family protein
MVRLSKKVEYGLIAMRHIATTPDGSVVTAKEIASLYRIPYELLAKVLQKLSKAGVIVSHHGVRGGYRLALRADEVPVSMVINAIEGTPPMIAQCMSEGPESCGVFDHCTIKSPLSKVQANIEKAFHELTLSEIM